MSVPSILPGDQTTLQIREKPSCPRGSAQWSVFLVAGAYGFVCLFLTANGREWEASPSVKRSCLGAASITPLLASSKSVGVSGFQPVSLLLLATFQGSLHKKHVLDPTL